MLIPPIANKSPFVPIARLRIEPDKFSPALSAFHFARVPLESKRGAQGPMKPELPSPLIALALW